MKITIIYDSFFGNTEQVAKAIGQALQSRAEVKTIRAGEARAEQLAGSDYVLVGSPTRKFSASEAIKGFLKNLPAQALKGVKVAAFDTRIAVGDIKSPIFRFIVSLGGYAAKPIADQLKRKGGDLLAAPEGFIVAKSEGPLKTGELERAATWARKLG